MDSPETYPTVSDYILLKTLGKGSFGKVKLAFNKNNKLHYALKLVKAGNFSNEVEVHKKLKHPNIINFEDYQEDVLYQKANGTSYKVNYIVLELASKGELYPYISYSGNFPEEISRFYFRQLIDALEFCHNNNIAHRDLNLGNMLLNEDYNLKLADFGFSTFLNRKLSTNLGSEEYKAPEINSDNTYEGPSADLFSAGKILFVIYSGFSPFQKADPGDSLYKLFSNPQTQNTYWKGYAKRGFCPPDTFKDLITSLLCLDPAKRLTIKEIRNHEWFGGPVILTSELKKHFEERELIVQKGLTKAILEKKKPRPDKDNSHFYGLNKFRSHDCLYDEMQVLNAIIQEKRMKYPEFDSNTRNIKKHTRSNYRCCEFASVIYLEYLYPALINKTEELFKTVTINERNFNISGKGSEDDGELDVLIDVTEIENYIYCVRFISKSGCPSGLNNALKIFKEAKTEDGNSLLIDYY